ncbi:MAG: SAM-dependent methyltransferase, partial [Acidimicrobiaceae bacterium]|nr:SAM-dependent methyltransferase [Acidimicrobiaceae bacterium]
MNESNQAQRDYWRTRLAWVERQEQMDLQLGVFGLAAMEALGDISGTNVLDVGCGCGHTTLQLNERVGSGSVVGVDISEKLLEVARRRGSGAIEFIEADAQSHAPQGPYDIIFS